MEDVKVEEPAQEQKPKREKKKLNLNAPSVVVKQPEPEPEPIFSYPAKKFDPIYGVIDFEAMGQCVDQFGNMYQLEPSQYVYEGKIYVYEYEEEPIKDDVKDDYFSSYDNNNNRADGRGGYQSNDRNNTKTQAQKPAEKKKAAKKPTDQKPIIKIPQRLVKLQQETDQQKLQSSLGNVKKEKRYTVKELQDLEAAVSNKDKYQVVDKDREPVNVVFIGHVDAGKSTLSGRVLVNCKEVDETELKNYEKEAIKHKREGWWLAYVMDINEDERIRGKTVECGKAHFQLSNRRFTLFDAPGHKNYVPNMIMGACQADVAVLIISAKTGEFESGFEKGGSTQEHAHLAKALGIQHLICVVTKMDQIEWSQDRFQHIQGLVSPFIKEQVGITSTQWVPVDSFNNINIEGRIDPSICQWYNGPSFFEILNTCPIPKRDLAGPIRIPVLSAIKENGQMFVYGKVESGCIKEDMWVTNLPNRKEFQIQEIYDTKDRRVFYAFAGENVKLKVKGIQESDIDKGNVVCNTDDFCQVTQEFQANVTIMELPEHKQIISDGYTAVLHLHTSVQLVDISSVDAIWDDSTKKYIRHNILKNGNKGIIKISTIGNSSLLSLEKYETNHVLGRFTLRDENKTIATGDITKIKPYLEF